MGWDRIQGGDCRVDRQVKLNTRCSWIAQGLDVGPVERTAHHRERARQANADSPPHVVDPLPTEPIGLNHGTSGPKCVNHRRLYSPVMIPTARGVFVMMPASHA